jgi:hypothetical protein
MKQRNIQLAVIRASWEIGSKVWQKLDAIWRVAGGYRVGAEILKGLRSRLRYLVLMLSNDVYSNTTRSRHLARTCGARGARSLGWAYLEYPWRSF